MYLPLLQQGLILKRLEITTFKKQRQSAWDQHSQYVILDYYKESQKVRDYLHIAQIPEEKLIMVTKAEPSVYFLWTKIKAQMTVTSKSPSPYHELSERSVITTTQGSHVSHMCLCSREPGGSNMAPLGHRWGRSTPQSIWGNDWLVELLSFLYHTPTVLRHHQSWQGSRIWCRAGVWR